MSDAGVEATSEATLGGKAKQLTSNAPDNSKTHIALVIYGKGIDAGKFRARDDASHIGLLTGGYYADYAMCYKGDAADYSDNFGPTWYWQTNIPCTPTATQLNLIAAAAKTWKAKGGAQGWPTNCRSFVAYVLRHILKLHPDGRWVGIGMDAQDPKKMAILAEFAQAIGLNVD
jgi:hypothetical protein